MDENIDLENAYKLAFLLSHELCEEVFFLFVGYIEACKANYYYDLSGRQKPKLDWKRFANKAICIEACKATYYYVANFVVLLFSFAKSSENLKFDQM